MGNYFKFVPVVQEMSLKRFFYFQIRWPFCSAEQDHFSNSGMRAIWGTFMQNYLKFGPMF